MKNNTNLFDQQEGRQILFLSWVMITNGDKDNTNESMTRVDDIDDN